MVAEQVNVAVFSGRVGGVAGWLFLSDEQFAASSATNTQRYNNKIPFIARFVDWRTGGAEQQQQQQMMDSVFVGFNTSAC